MGLDLKERQQRLQEEEEEEPSQGEKFSRFSCIEIYSSFHRLSGVVLTQQDYYTIPSIDELDDLVEDGRCVVTGFTIGRRGYGEIHFPDKTDVFGMNLDQLG